MIIKIYDSNYSVRLDRYLRETFNITQSLIEKSLRNKDILVNDSRVKSSYKLIEQDVIKIKHTWEEASNIKPEISQALINKYLNIIYEDDFMLAINKAPGLAAQGGSKIKISLDEILKAVNPDYRLVHRIDKDTSGILLIAKNKEMANILTRAFEERLIKKKYTAILIGKQPNASGAIECYLSKDAVSNDFQKIIEDPVKGRYSLTEYKLIKILGESRYLVEFTPITGRMHQLRFHATKIKCYIEGDSKYGPSSSSNKINRLKLHASYLFIPSILDEKLKENISVISEADFV